MKKLCFWILFFFLAVPAYGQRTIVSGTVTDSSGIPYSGASLTASLSLPTGAIGAYLGGAQIAGSVGPVTLDSTGSFLLQLADNTQIQCANSAGQIVACAPQTTWSIRVTLSPGVAPPVGTGPQTCNAALTITGASQSVTSSFNACSRLVVSGVGATPAGSNGQVQFNNNGAFGADPNLTWNQGGCTSCLWVHSTFQIGGNGTTNNPLLIRDAGNTNLVFVLAGTSQLTAGSFATITNCAVNSASPAACGSASSGAFVDPATTTSYTVNTTAVSAASRVMVTAMSFAGNLPSAPTCTVPSTPFVATLSAISAGTSFTLTLPSSAGQTCWQYWIVN